jgi:HSP20 family protein
MTSINIYRPFDNLLRQVFDDAAPATSALAPFKVDIQETDDAYRIKAEVPGVKRDDIDISVEDRVLSVAAKFTRESEEKDAKTVRAERVSGSFSRSFELPREIAEDKIKAELNNGVLTLSLPKSEAAAKKNIAIA